MCGIAGIFNLQGSETLQARHIHAMADRMIHRGPDDEGYVLVNNNGECLSRLGDATPGYNQGTSAVPAYPKEHIRNSYGTRSVVALGHRRLSIVDLSPHGHQPLCTPDHRYWVIFNGEIYNSQEIARALEKEGVCFHGRSDTETLINAYVVWGEHCLERFNGMFAFAIWDNREKVLFCARDRIGIKPFYYTVQDGQFIFASDIKTLIASGLYVPEPDMQGLYLSMAFGMAPRPMTAFKDIVALEQGHWMRIYPDGRIIKQRYWSIPVCTQDHAMTETDAMELLEERLTASIRLRLVADVPVGTFMSGGIDSTTISAIAAQHHPGIKAFTLAYENTAPELDEVPQARATAALHPMEHIIHTVNPDDSLQHLDEWIDGYEEPFHGLASNHVISHRVREDNVTVILNGLGGDELFAGYDYYRWLARWRLMRKIKPLLAPVLAPYFLGRKANKLLSIITAASADRLHSVMFSVRLDRELRPLFASKEMKEIDSVETLHNLYVGNLRFDDDFEAMSYMDFMNYISNHHVHRIDQFTMAHSLEGRFPFLDHELIEAAFRIPTRYKLNGKVQKYILRQVARKYITPECLTMKKKGFSLPLKQWMAGPLKELVRSRLQRLKQRPYIVAEEVGRYFKAFQSGRGNAERLWHLVALELWHERFFDTDNT